MNTKLYSLEQHLLQLDIPNSNTLDNITFLYNGSESILQATWNLLKALGTLISDIIAAIKNILVKIYRWIEFKFHTASSNCRIISSKRSKQDYKTKVDSIVFDKGIPKSTLINYLISTTNAIKLLQQLINEANIVKQIEELDNLEQNDDGQYLRITNCPLEETKIRPLKAQLDALGISVDITKTQTIGNFIFLEDCKVSTRSDFATHFVQSQTLAQLGYTVDDVLKIYPKEFTNAYKSIDTVHDYISQLTNFRKQLDKLYEKVVKANNPGDVSNTNHKVNRCKLLSKNLFICAQIYTALLNSLTEPTNYFTELTNVLANAI